ncbi:hypothetical protein TEA_011535 [Camellia sinensis var. sinensis]|uniref:Prefoldin subunit 5 n=1 Tax=Camellia sinensis var. sinensis TaxID=542762 RepID=A0A4S4EZV9_CAMSN|nr:hypothetical protein TEA_011535 [Camellia sinensis var. sinensis]
MASRGGGSGGAMMRAAEIDKMSVEQLKALKEQADLEVNLLQDSLNNIRTATARLDIASTSLHDLSLRPQGKKMLVPLTASLYVPGTLDDADKVLVDVGTGYFIEVYWRLGDVRTVSDLQGCRDVKVMFGLGNKFICVGKNLTTPCNGGGPGLNSRVATKKKNIADEVGVILQAKLKQLAPTP